MHFTKHPYWQKPDKKVWADLIVSVLTFLALGFGLEVTPELAAILGKLAGFAAAYFTRNEK